MAVNHDVASESHTGTTGSASEASFSWSHNPVGVPKGVLVFTFTNANANDATAVTYDGVALTAVTGGRAVDTAGEAGDCKAWFLGSSVPTTDPATVIVTRNNNANVMYAQCITVTALTDTEVTGVLLEQEDQALTEENVDDGSPGTNSLRYVGLMSGRAQLADIPAGANSNQLAGIDFGARLAATYRESVAGQGSRPVGADTATNVDDVAAVYLAVREVSGAGPQTLTGALFTKAPTFFTGTVTATRTLTGTLFTKAPTFLTGAVSLAAGPQTVNGVLFTKAPTFPQGAVTSTYALTGTLFVKAPTFFTGTVTAGAVTLNGSLFTKAPTFPQGTVTAGAVSLTGVLFQKAPTFPTGTVTTTVTLTGSLFVKAPTFFTGTIGQAGTLFGTLFVKAPTFFTGSLTPGAPSFWQPDPAGWTANPSAFVRVGRYGPSPWGAELSGQRFEKAPTFPAGVVS